MRVFVGMMCAVRFSADQLFYRAEILNVVDANNIEVKYVDYGNIEVVTVQRIRKLLDIYTVLTVQVSCNLFMAGFVKPGQGDFPAGANFSISGVRGLNSDGKFKADGRPDSMLRTSDCLLSYMSSYILLCSEGLWSLFATNLCLLVVSLCVDVWTNVS